MTKIFVGVPIFDYIDPKVRENQIKFLDMSGYEYVYREISGTGIDIARNQLFYDYY